MKMVIGQVGNTLDLKMLIMNMKKILKKKIQHILKLKLKMTISQMKYQKKYIF